MTRPARRDPHGCVSVGWQGAVELTGPTPAALKMHRRSDRRTETLDAACPMKCPDGPADAQFTTDADARLRRLAGSLRTPIAWDGERVF